MGKTKENLKLKTIVNFLEMSNNQKAIVSVLTDAIIMLNKDEITELSKELKKIKSKFTIEYKFLSCKIHEIKELTEIERKTLNTVNEERIADVLNSLFNSAEFIPNNMRDYVIENFEKDSDLIDEIFNNNEKEKEDEIEKEITILNLADFITEKCKEEEIELESLISKLLIVSDIEKVYKYTNELIELIDDMEDLDIFDSKKATKDVIKEIFGEDVKIRNTSIDYVPKHLRKELKNLLINNYDEDLHALKIDTSKVSKELLNFLDENSKEVY